MTIIIIPAIIILGDFIGYLSRVGSGKFWFLHLVKPFFMPPAWLFVLSWNVCYALMGIALAMVLAEESSSRRKLALLLFFVQLALNYAWAPIFFAAHDLGLAKVVIFVMTAIAAAAAGQFMRIHRPAGLLMIPYLAWLVFAATLNSTIELLNPGAGTSLLG
jgi:tryptophan-rich sensory protein